MKLNSPIFNDQQKRRAIIWLSFFHIFIIAASNYFVQIPFEITLKLTALDLLNHSILRAFYVILGQEPINTLFLYQDQQGCLAVCERLQQRQVLQSQSDLSELYQQFIQRFPETIEQVYVYQTPDILNSRTIESLPQDWQRIETDLPFIALGNALWQTDLKLVDLSSKTPALLPPINRESDDVKP